MPVVLDNDPGHRVALYLWTGSAWVKARTDTLARLHIAEARERNPLTIGLAYLAGGVAPHAATTRFTYTVPASRAAILSDVFFSVMRDAAAAPVGLVSARLVLTTLTSGSPWLIEVSFIGNTVGDMTQNMLAPALYLRAGETIAAISDDASTGGSARYLLNAALTEFDF